jgi:hypothetical protein
MAVVAAVGIADLTDVRGPLRWVRLWPLLLPPTVSMLVTLWLWSEARGASDASLWVSSSKGILLGPFLSGAAAVGVIAAARGAKWALPALVLFAAADQVMFARDYLGLNPTRSLDKIVATMIPRPPGPSTGRIANDGRPDLGILIDQRLVGGYAVLMPRRALDYERPLVLRIAGASWKRDKDGRWTPLPGPLPRARLVVHAITRNESGSEIDRVDPVEVAIVRSPLDLAGREPGEASVISDRPGRIQVATRANSRQLLVLSESFHDGWRLTVDGRVAPVVRVYDDFLGAVVGPGSHRVAFDFHPASLRNGIAISAAGLLLLLITLLVPLPTVTPIAETTGSG